MAGYYATYERFCCSFCGFVINTFYWILPISVAVYSSLDHHTIVTLFFAGPVTNLHKTSVTMNTVVLSWDAPRDSSGTIIPVVVIIMSKYIFSSMIEFICF